MKFFNAIDKFGYGISLLVGLSLFLSEKFENNVVIPLLVVLFLISMLSRENRQKLQLWDRNISIFLIIFIAVSFIIPFFDGGLKTRLDNYNLRYLLYFPLIFFVNNDKKLFKFLLSFALGSLIIIVLATTEFIKNYKEWANPVGFEYPRVTVEKLLTVQDFANLMCIIVLFALSFLLFYKHEDERKNIFVKIFFLFLTAASLFLVIVNRSKMVYICLLPTILYIMFKKNKKYIISFFIFCFVGYFILPTSITDRLKYIVDYKSDPSSYLRVIFWDTGLHAFMKKPIYGWRAEERKEFNLNYYKKAGTSEYVYVNFLNPTSKIKDYVNAHNTYLQYLLEYGILGFVTLALVLLNEWIKLFKIKFYKNQIDTNKLIALEIATKTSFFAWLIQGLTEINLNSKHMIIALTVIIFFINYLYNRSKISKINLKQ